jgi:Rrf2 family iron-sulfur cluster assembly transcriptional regulator
MRLEITRRADLAVRAMVVLGEANGLVKATALAEALDATPGFVPQVVGPLVKAGWVRSEPGPTGGYASSVDLSDVSVLAVIEAVDGATDDGRCVVADRSCDGSAPCSLHVAWTKARNELVGVLGATTLSEVAHEAR